MASLKELRQKLNTFLNTSRIQFNFFQNLNSGTIHGNTHTRHEDNMRITFTPGQVAMLIERAERQLEQIVSERENGPGRNISRERAARTARSRSTMR